MDVMDDVITRMATPADLRKVLEINRSVYFGMDYVENQYMDFIKDPDFASYLCEIDNKVVAFRAACVVDGDATMMLRSGRVHPDYQGRGLMVRLLQALKDDFRQRMSSIQHVASSNGNTCKFRYAKSYLEKNRLLFNRTMTFHMIDTSKQRQIPSTQEFQSLTIDDLNKLYLDEELTAYLFPKKRIVINSWHLKTIPENRRHLEKQKPVILLKGSNPDKENAMLSISTMVLVQLGRSIHIDFFGRVTVEDITDHVKGHLSAMSDKIDNVVYVMSYIDESFDIGMVDAAFNNIGAERLDFPMTDLDYFESKF